MDEERIAENINKIRCQRRMSLNRLAQLCGLTKGYLSKIENSRKAPPFSTLKKIASALEVDVGLLLSGESEAETPKDMKLCVVRAADRKDVTSLGTLYGYHYEALAYRKAGKNMEPYLIEPAFGSETTFSHEGEEFMYVLEGAHEFTYGDDTIVLEKGDSIYFDSSVPHSGRSIGPEQAKILAVLYYYKRL